MDVDVIMAELARQQHGIVARGQLLEAGVTADRIDRKLKRGRLHAMHRGVYRVGPVEVPGAREMAAVLACGPSSFLSHGSAATLWELAPRGKAAAIPEVIDRRASHRRPGVRVHHIRTLQDDEVTQLDRIPITTPARTLLDLCGSVPPRTLERAMAEAFARKLATPARLSDLLERHAVKGKRILRALLEDGSPARSRSEAEERFLGMVREAQLDAPEVNVDVAGYEVDFFWRREGLVVEVDGRAFHTARRAFEMDRRRDADLAAQGLRVMRVTWRQLVNEPSAVLVRLARALAPASHWDARA